MENENSTKELDLIDIIKICWGWFIKYIWCPFLFVLRFALKKWWVGAFAVIFGLGISYVVSEYFPKYVGNVIFKNNVCKSSDFIHSVRLMSHSPAEYKAQVLGVDLKVAIAIKAIWGHQLCYSDSLQSGYDIDITDKLVSAGRECVPDMFDVEIITDDKAVFDDVQNALLNYFNSSDFFVNQNKQRFDALSSSLSSTNSEIHKLDSIRKAENGAVVTAQSSIVNGQAVSTVLNPTVISQEIMRLNEVSTSLSSVINYSPDIVEVVSPIKYNCAPINHISYIWSKYVIMSLAVFYIIALIVVYRKNVLAFIKG